MAKTRREFSPEFKREAVALLETSGRPLMQVAMEVGISPSMLRTWRALIRDGAARSRPAAPGIPLLPSPADQASEITRLKRELDRTRMERDVLKNCRGSGPPVGGETADAILRMEGSGRLLFGGV